MEKLRMQTPDSVEQNIEKIATLFPNCVTETTDTQGNVKHVIDFDKLKQELSNAVIDDREQRYEFTWPDKRKAGLLAGSPIRMTLRPCREESVDFDNTRNLYIEGDNLDVLKCLKETYLGKVKMIYIDPPYNTGNDFVYHDSFTSSVDEYTAQSGQRDEEGNRLVTNLESNGRFHTDWLNMIYPRLKAARDLLADDGVIFISIDDHEAANLKKVCDEVFGERNFIAEFPRLTKKGGKSTDKYVRNHDYILCYSRDVNGLKIFGIEHVDEGFKYKDEFHDKRGPYKLNQTLDYNTLQYNESMDYRLNIDGKDYVPGGDFAQYEKRHLGKHGEHDWVWRWSKKLFEFGYNNGWIVISKTGRIYTKTYLNAIISKNALGNYMIEYKERTKQLSTIEFIENLYSNDSSYKEITKLMGAPLFDYVKPSSLIKQMIRTTTNKDSLILDFFSGSATTAHAVMQLNAEDGGNRRYIMVQIPEACKEGSEAAKAGYKTICEIGKERIRRAGKKIKEELAAKREKEGMFKDESVPTLDTGFRVLKLDTTNMKDVYYRPQDVSQNDLFDQVDNVKEDRNAEDLLFQVMLECNVTLDSPIEREEIEGKTVYNVNHDFLLACFDKNVTDSVVTAIAKRHPTYAIFRDASLDSDAAATNIDEIFKTYSNETTRRVI